MVLAASAFVLYSATKSVDLATTEWALRRNPNAFELNPLGRTTAGRVGLAVAEVAGEAFITKRLERSHPRWAKAVKIFVPAVHLGLGAWNVRQALRGGGGK